MYNKIIYPEPVFFASADGHTILTAYLWKPVGVKSGSGIIMLHGRRGPYSTASDGIYTARFLSKRHLMWGSYWSRNGYTALHVDSFGPRGYLEGFPESSYSSRPEQVSERTVRPLDAYGALAWLRSQPYVGKNPVGLHGWSNGAMAALWAMSHTMPAKLRLEPKEGFAAALVLYPGCDGLLQAACEYDT